MSPPDSQTKTTLFTPLSLGSNLTLSHRIIMAPLTRFRCTSSHVPLTSMVSEYYAQRCSTPGGLIIAESNIISPEHGGVKHMPGLWNEEQISAWKPIVDEVHAKGCYIFAQLIALGRVADPEVLRNEGGWDVKSSSQVPFPDAVEGGVVPKEMLKEEIQTALQKFAQAAKNAVFEAGFDGIELHGANGYLIDQFTQDVTNRRTDEYGGSVENRSRFGVEVARACAEAVGEERVGFRISPFSTFQGMKMDDPVEQFGDLVRRLKDLGLAYLHVVESRVVNNVDCEKQEGIEPFLEIWGKTSPVLVAGGLTPELAKKAVETEYTKQGCEVAVVFGRHFISNPDLVYRIKEGLELNKYDRSTFYTPEIREGYLDYPFSQEYSQQCNGSGETSVSGSP
ncbi:Chanoclavine-I aldehyde reductase [Cercospora beticola]|uniref:Chanoclavine-I aldehyde reductase n=1 Tax=Cercospora beticola TaxID=122368 RepID=A0A2G5HFY8_CERBT|nr:Chanoclavine-I aldehyde reductase [Cercospora beticola]PIA91464.1 Chanoclavine-I aldehyde reductase [Cercospora beticola]WPB06222.1 hypothetical protein RHO25_010879 [Cercospora beticola]CAK1366105.1 unnamed protein product [Cercospora beticola]